MTRAASNAIHGPRFSAGDFAGFLITLLFTFVLNAIGVLPRAELLIRLFTAYIHVAGSVLILPRDIYSATLIFDSLTFLSAFVTGVVAMLAAKAMVPHADPRRVMSAATIAIFIYAVLITRPGQQFPGVLPTHLALAAAIPGWFLGYLAAAGPFARRQLRWFTVPGFLILTILFALGIGLMPPWMNFHMVNSHRIIPMFGYGPRP